MRRAALLVFALASCVLDAAGAAAVTLKATLISPQDDPRLERTRLERAYLGHPGGPAADGVKLALDDAGFELEAAGAAIALSQAPARSIETARAAALAAEKGGAGLILTDLPPDWTAAVADAVKLPVLNLGASDDGLRQQDCRPRLFHLLPSERMRADAIAQALVSRKWNKLLLLVGPSPPDAQRAATAQASIRRYGLQVVASRPFKLSTDPR
jgi:ABC transporter substrate binding protein (PQQ-dependent alcohol dehydrogenase system)